MPYRSSDPDDEPDTEIRDEGIIGVAFEFSLPSTTDTDQSPSFSADTISVRLWQNPPARSLKMGRHTTWNLGAVDAEGPRLATKIPLAIDQLLFEFGRATKRGSSDGRPIR